MPDPRARRVLGPNYGGSLQKPRSSQSPVTVSAAQKEDAFDDESDELMEVTKKQPKTWNTFIKPRASVQWQPTKRKREILVDCSLAIRLLREHLKRRSEEGKGITALQIALYEEFIDLLNEIVDRQSMPHRPRFNVAGSAYFHEEGTMNLLQYRVRELVVPSSFFHICDSAITRANSKPLRII